MQVEQKIKVGNIKNFVGQKVDGLINRSSLTNYQSDGVSEQYSIKYVYKGKETYIIDDVKHELFEGQFLLVKPHQHIKILIEGKEETTGTCVYFDQDFFENHILNPIHKNPHLGLPSFAINANNLSVKSFYDALFFNLNNLNTDTYLLKCANTFHQFFSSSLTQLNTLTSEKWKTKNSIWEKLENSRRFIHSQCSNQIKLKEIADASCISMYHFQRCFKKFYGISPSQYLHYVRMKKAQILISEGQSIQVVAIQCGFLDTKYFKKCLKDFLNQRN